MSAGRRQAWRIPLVVALLLMAPVSAAAHVFWPAYHSAKSAVSLDHDGLQAAVVLEVPTDRLVADFKAHFAELDLMTEIEAGRFEKLEDAFREHQFEILAATLSLEVDGAPAAGRWRPVDTPVNGMGTEGFFVYMFEFAFETQPPLHEGLAVRLLNRAFPDDEVVMANVAEARDGWRVVTSTIPPPEEIELPKGAVLDDPELGLWTIDPVKRDLLVTFGRAADAASGPSPEEPR